ncbi:MAG: phospholipase D-like domain-containing protein [Halobacteriota archaeon]
MSPYLAKADGLSVTAYAGDGSVLLAFNLDETKTDNLAGFAIKAKTPDKGPYPTSEYWLKNRLNFEKGITSEMLLTPDLRVGSDKAPFQAFHWIHFPGAGPGQYTYTVYPSYFLDRGALTRGPGTSVDVDLSYRSLPYMELGFTRGVISSQAYADRFQNADIEPNVKAIDFDTAPYVKQYEWLGAHARKMVFDFLKECLNDPSLSLDVFSYDLNEPDVIRWIAAMGPRARVIQDDSDSHTKQSALEPQAVKALEEKNATAKLGHFRQLAHNKVFIQKRAGHAIKVLTGSTNFSIRGLYVQANSVAIFNDPKIADLYEQAFEQAFNAMGDFSSSLIASQWFDVATDAAPPMSFSFAPHAADFTLDTVSQAIESAKSSVLFAVMQMGGKGPVMLALENLGTRDDLFSLGTVDMKGALKLFKQGKSHGVTTKDYLREDAPAPFKPELSGLGGHVIHHKFIVCDFNGENPVVFCGSSNLAEGGETKNGDNLIAIRDRSIVYNYAVEAIRLYDHYRFRSLHERSTANEPLVLDPSDGWVKPYYESNDIKFYERSVFSRA